MLTGYKNRGPLTYCNGLVTFDDIRNEALLRYGKLDTLAMVKVWEKLKTMKKSKIE